MYKRIAPDSSVSFQTRVYPSGLKCLLGLEDLGHECIGPDMSVSFTESVKDQSVESISELAESVTQLDKTRHKLVDRNSQCAIDRNSSESAVRRESSQERV